MVLIALKAQYVSLIITFASLIAEFAFLAAVIAFNRYLECVRLRKGRQISVGRHQLRIKVISLGALLLFLAMEIVASNLSDPINRFTLSDEPCVALDVLTNRNPPSGELFEETVIFAKCMDFKNGNFEVTAGNYSKVREEVRCSGSTAMRFPPENEVNHVFEGAKRVSEEDPAPDPLLHCQEAVCVIAQTMPSVAGANWTTIRISDFIRESEVGEALGAVRVLDTDVFFDTNGLLSEFAQRFLRAGLNGVSDTMEARKRTFLGVEEDRCPFGEPQAATTVPLALVYCLGFVWLTSVVVGVASLLLRRRSFYDISSPLCWAKKTRFSADAKIEGDPVLTSVYENGEHVVYVGNAPSK